VEVLTADLTTECGLGAVPREQGTRGQRRRRAGRHGGSVDGRQKSGWRSNGGVLCAEVRESSRDDTEQSIGEGDLRVERPCLAQCTFDFFCDVFREEARKVRLSDLVQLGARGGEIIECRREPAGDEVLVDTFDRFQGHAAKVTPDGVSGC
jgi:hypothetical protein